MVFVDRHQELEILGSHLDRPGASLFVLYGRRRVGKTALLRRAIADRPNVAYHVGTRSTPVEEFARLSATLADRWHNPLLAAQPLGSISAFCAFLESCSRTNAIIVLDEFPYLAETDSSLPGSLQALWDRSLSDGALKIVVCGSSITMMESTFFAAHAPLFGRRTGQMQLGPLPTRAVAELFPNRAPAEIVEIVALFGAIPGYLQRLTPELSPADNIRRNLVVPGEPLYEEVPFLLREELREPRVYAAILSVIAGGARKFGEISSKVGLDKANLTRYLSILASLGLVEREVPVTEVRPDKSRKGLYRVADPFVSTWYALVHPLRDRIEAGEGETLWRDVATRIEQCLPHAVEPVVRDLFLETCSDRIPFEVAYRGRHWSNVAEYDAVYLDAERRRAFVVETKWGKNPVPASTLDELRRTVAADPSLAGFECTCAVLSRAGFAGAIAGADRPYLVSANELVGTLP